VVTGTAKNDRVTAGRTYTDPSTNPRHMPLADGKYGVEVRAIGLKGDITRRFEVEIRDGTTVEKQVDFSTGEISIGVTRNGELSDAVYKVYVAGTRREVASGRTYASASSNPAVVKITSGEYDVEVGSVEIEGRPWQALGRVTAQPRGRSDASHDFSSGTLKIGVVRGGELVDAVIGIYKKDGEAARGRTYTNPKTNPRSFVLLPGKYRVDIREIRGDQREITVTVGKEELVERTVDLAEGD